MTMHRRLPLLGHLPWFWRDTNEFLLRLAREQGDVARFRLGRTEAFLLSHPDHVRRVLVDDVAAFRKGRLMQRARRLLGDGLLTSEGVRHHAQRRRIQPAFCRQQLEFYGEMVPSAAAAIAGRWREGVSIDIGSAMDELTLRIVARTLLGADLEAGPMPLAAELRLLARRAPLLALPLAGTLERAGLPPFREAGHAATRVKAAVRRWLEDEVPGTGRDLRSLLRSMPAQDAQDEAMTLFLAGHDTTAGALTWAWHLLAGHPEVRCRLEQELDEVLGDRDPTPADLPSLGYTGMVLEETLRLYPPIGRIGRRPLQDYAFDGCCIPANAPVFLSPYVTQRDPRWWPEPARFDPLRWAPESTAARPRYASYAFGAGPRSCIGAGMARIVGVLAIATIARRWRLQDTPGASPRIRGLLTLKPAEPICLTPMNRERGCIGASAHAKGVQPQTGKSVADM